MAILIFSFIYVRQNDITKIKNEEKMFCFKWDKYGGRTRANESKDTNKARNAASCNSVVVAAGSFC